MTQESPPSMSRNSTARTSPARSLQKLRMTVRLSGSEFMVTTRKIAERVSGATTACATAFTEFAPSGVEFGPDSIGCHPLGAGRVSFFEKSGLPRMQTTRPQAYHCFPSSVHAEFRKGGRQLAGYFGVNGCREL